MSEPFLITKGSRRFFEFCKACHKFRYIGLCYGPAGVGKTVSARHFAQWEMFDPLVNPPLGTQSPVLSVTAVNSNTVFSTADVVCNPSRLQSQITHLLWKFDDVIEAAIDANSKEERPISTYRKHAELLIIDEADRLKSLGLEVARDVFDRTGVAVILIGMPGMEKRLSRYPQLYSRIGFVHEFKPLSTEELLFILEHKWEQLGLCFKRDDFTDAEAAAAVARITQGNFRLLQRLFTQIKRLMELNQMSSITKELVETARENLVIGLS